MYKWGARRHRLPSKGFRRVGPTEVPAMRYPTTIDAFGRERLKFRVDGDVIKYWYNKVLRMTLTDAATDALEGRVSPTAHLREVVAAQAVLGPPYLVDVRTDIECPLVRALKEG